MNKHELQSQFASMKSFIYLVLADLEYMRGDNIGAGIFLGLTVLSFIVAVIRISKSKK